MPEADCQMAGRKDNVEMDEKNTNNAQGGIQQVEDKNKALDVHNEELEKVLNEYMEERTNEKLRKLIDVIIGCRLLVPAVVNEENKPYPLTITSNQQEKFIPVYTSVAQIPKDPKSPAILNMPYILVNHMAANGKSELAGVVINPFSQNLVFKKQLTEKIKNEFDARRKRATEQGEGGTKTMQVTQEQYNVLTRKQYEFNFLPKKFFEGGQEFIDALCDQKEEFIDQLYEEAYQEKRLYPYLPEDFSVMIMDISEELLVIRVDFPEQNMTAPSCYRIYFTWNAKTKEGRYFTIEKTKEREAKLLGEMNDKIQHVSHGEAPVEGAELQEIIDLHQGTAKQTS